MNLYSKAMAFKKKSVKTDGQVTISRFHVAREKLRTVQINFPLRKNNCPSRKIIPHDAQFMGWRFGGGLVEVLDGTLY